MAKGKRPTIRNAHLIGKGGKRVKAINGSFREGYRQAFGKPKPKASPVKTALKSTTSLTPPSSGAFAKAVKTAKAKPVRRVTPQMRSAIKRTPTPKNVSRTIKRKPPTKGR